MRKILIAIILTTFILPLQADAAAVCACYFGQKNDCELLAVADDAKIENCTLDCKRKYPQEFKKIDFHSDSSFANNITLACAQAHTDATLVEPKTDAIVPKLNVEIPGVQFTPIKQIGNELNINFIGDYISGVYKYLISISVVIAIVFIMVGGMQWSLSAGASSQLGAAKERIKNALIGLVLLLSVVLILQIVNPQLAELNAVRVKFVEEIPMEAFDDPGDIAPEGSLPDAPPPPPGSNFFNGTQLCSSQSACIKWCNENKDVSGWPTSNKKTVDISLTKKIPNFPGVTNVSNTRGTPELIEAMQKAGQIAIAKNPKYLITIRSGYRPLKTQIQLVCKGVYAQNQSEIDKIGKIIAYPGGSNHGSSVAVDIRLSEDGKELVTSSSKAQNEPQYAQGAKILADIMAEAGFVRYSKEIWHFELEGKTTTDCRCKGAECPFPPRRC